MRHAKLVRRDARRRSLLRLVARDAYAWLPRADGRGWIRWYCCWCRGDNPELYATDTFHRAGCPVPALEARLVALGGRLP